MKRSENASYSMVQEQIQFFGKIQGAGAAAPVRVPTTQSSTSIVGWMPSSVNFVSTVATDITRSSAGVYTVKFSDGLPLVIDIDTNVWGPAATAKDVIAQDFNPSTNVFSFSVILRSSSALTDLAAADFCVFTITGAKNLPVY